MNTPVRKKSLLEHLVWSALTVVLGVGGAFGGAWLGFVTVLEGVGGQLGVPLAVIIGLPVGFFAGLAAAALTLALLMLAWRIVRPRPKSPPPPANPA